MDQLTDDEIMIVMCASFSIIPRVLRRSNVWTLGKLRSVGLDITTKSIPHVGAEVYLDGVLIGSHDMCGYIKPNIKNWIHAVSEEKVKARFISNKKILDIFSLKKEDVVYQLKLLDYADECFNLFSSTLTAYQVELEGDGLMSRKECLERVNNSQRKYKELYTIHNELRKEVEFWELWYKDK